MKNDEKRKQLLLELESSNYRNFYSNFAHNYCNFSTYLGDNFISAKELRELQLSDLLKCYCKIGSTEFYVYRYIDKIVKHLENEHNFKIEDKS